MATEDDMKTLMNLDGVAAVGEGEKSLVVFVETDEDREHVEGVITKKGIDVENILVSGEIEKEIDREDIPEERSSSHD